MSSAAWEVRPRPLPTSAPPACRAIVPMWVGDPCCHLGGGEPQPSLPTLCTHSQHPIDGDWPLAFSPSHCPRPPRRDCSCTEPVGGQSLHGDCVCLALEKLCSAVDTAAGWVSTRVCKGTNLKSQQQPLLSIQKPTLFLSLIELHLLKAIE